MDDVRGQSEPTCRWEPHRCMTRSLHTAHHHIYNGIGNIRLCLEFGDLENTPKQMTVPSPAHLEPSELGTKEYWDEYYKTDLSSTPSPTASVDGWFSDVNATGKILDHLTGAALELDLKSTSFIDLGTGTGEMLLRLRQEGGFEGSMLGVDYSPPSVQLAKKIAAAKQLSPGQELQFAVWDIIHDEIPSSWHDGFDVVLDKGTFDAISLSADRDEHGRRICESYRAKVEKLVKIGGLLVVTSCNWTEGELETWFTGSGSSLIIKTRISYPSFAFGGQTGQSISTLCFTRAG